MRFHLEVKPFGNSNPAVQFYFTNLVLPPMQISYAQRASMPDILDDLTYGGFHLFGLWPCTNDSDGSPQNLCLWFIVCNILRNYFLMQTKFMDGGPLLKQLALLTDEVKSLETETRRGSESSSGSPRQVSSSAVRGSALLGHRDLFSPTGSVSPRSVAGPGSRSRRGS